MVPEPYTQFLRRFFERPPETLTADIAEQGRAILWDPLQHEAFCREHGIEPTAFGLYLGEDKHGFMPSPACIERIGAHIDASRKAVLDEKGAWLFLCGRDAFGAAVEKGNPDRGAATIVTDARGDTLGYGEWLVSRITGRENARPVLKNRIDMGLYLRR